MKQSFSDELGGETENCFLHPNLFETQQNEDTSYEERTNDDTTQDGSYTDERPDESAYFRQVVEETAERVAPFFERARLENAARQEAKEADGAIAAETDPLQELADAAQGQPPMLPRVGSFHSYTNEDLDGLIYYKKVLEPSENGFIQPHPSVPAQQAEDTRDETRGNAEVVHASVAVEQEDLETQFNLGLRYEKGLGVKQDEARAAEIFERSANKGHAGAQYRLARMYRDGRGVIQNYTQAVHFFQRAAGDKKWRARAWHNLGLLHQEGLGGEKDSEMAQHLFKLAKEEGYKKQSCSVM